MHSYRPPISSPPFPSPHVVHDVTPPRFLDYCISPPNLVDPSLSDRKPSQVTIYLQTADKARRYIYMRRLLLQFRASLMRFYSSSRADPSDLHYSNTWPPPEPRAGSPSFRSKHYSTCPLLRSRIPNPDTHRQLLGWVKRQRSRLPSISSTGAHGTTPCVRFWLASFFAHHVGHAL
jgi:hypothetical protein